MTDALRHLCRTVGGLLALLRLGVRTRFRFNGPYWQWRMETAFGSDPSRRPPRRELRRAALDYGRWIHRMRGM